MLWNLSLTKYRVHDLFYFSIILNSQTPAFGGISLALRGRGAFGAPVRAPVAPIWATAAFGGCERKKKNWGVSLAYAVFGGDKKM